LKLERIDTPQTTFISQRLDNFKPTALDELPTELRELCLMYQRGANKKREHALSLESDPDLGFAP